MVDSVMVILFLYLRPMEYDDIEIGLSFKRELQLLTYSIIRQKMPELFNART